MIFSSRIFLFIGICANGPGGSRSADYTPMNATTTLFVGSGAVPG